MSNKLALLIVTLLFSAPLFGCGPDVDQDRVDTIVALDKNAAMGMTFYSTKCQSCHGPGGDGSGVGPDLRNGAYNQQQIAEALLTGPSSMPDFSGESDQDLANVIGHVSGL